MNALEDLVQDYLRLRRSLGFKLEKNERFLRQYCEYLARTGQERVTTQSMLEWATSPDTTAYWHGSRLSALRVFANWAHAFDPHIEIPPRRLLPVQGLRSVPFIYSQDQILALLEQAGKLRPPMVSATYRTLIGLLACTGMRVGEAINADRRDLQDGVLTIRDTKFGKTRLLPLHESVQGALAEYASARRRLLRVPARTEALLISTAGTRLIYKNVHFFFHRLVAQTGISPRSQSCRPRIHDLRHSFAVSTLLSAYRDGQNPAEILPVLSTYLGHANPVSTYWYLEADPELLTEAARRLTPLETREHPS